MANYGVYLFPHFVIWEFWQTFHTVSSGTHFSTFSIKMRTLSSMKMSSKISSITVCHENIYENVVCKTTVILFRPQYVWSSRCIVHAEYHFMMTSSNGNIFRVTGILCTGPGEFPHKGQWRGALMFSLICTWINGWVNNREAGDLRPIRTHYDVCVMYQTWTYQCRIHK